jgi:uncharacterized protein
VASLRKIDCHMHVVGGPHRWGWADNAQIIDAADRLGIDHLVCSVPVTGGRWATPAQVQECNNAVLHAMRAFPGRILGYCFVNPGFGREALEEIERCVVDEGMVGVKLYNQYKINDPVVFPIIERTIELGVPILSHAGRLVDPADLALQPLTSHAADFVEVGRRYPEAMIIEGHIAGGGDWDFVYRLSSRGWRRCSRAPFRCFWSSSGQGGSSSAPGCHSSIRRRPSSSWSFWRRLKR